MYIHSFDKTFKSILVIFIFKVYICDKKIFRSILENFLNIILYIVKKICLLYLGTNIKFTIIIDIDFVYKIVKIDSILSFTKQLTFQYVLLKKKNRRLKMENK